MGNDGFSGQTSRRLNPLSRLVARAGVSIRAKLLIAFLGITLLMAGLALFGLNALQNANARTEALIRDQKVAAAYYEIYGFLGEASLHAVASLAFEPDGDFSGQDDLLNNPAFVLLAGLGNYERSLAQMRRQIGGDGDRHTARLTRFISEIRRLEPRSRELKRARDSNDLSEAEEIVIRQLLPKLRGMQREAFSIAKATETRMVETARITAAAFLASRQQVIAAALVAIGLALLMGYVMSSALIWPVRRIGDVLGRVAGGRFDTLVWVPNRDELGGLAENVNSMTARLAELYDEVDAQKEQLRGWNTALEDKVAAQVDEIARANRLRRFLPAQVADLIVQGEGESDLLGVKRGEITVLFADLRGFTAFSNAVPPAQVIGALNAFHASAGPVVEAHGGTIERFLGDGVMVLFGAPVAMEDAAQRAVDTAVAMMTAVESALSDMGPAAKELGLGIGIGSGVATLGQIGFEGRQDYSAIGPAPNLAARLCDVAAAGQILISHATAWQVTMEMDPVGPFELKGIGAEVAAFEINRS